MNITAQNIFLLVFLLLSLQCFSQNSETIEKIKGDEFGKTLLQAVQVQIKTSANPFKKIENMLLSMEEQITNEASKDVEESKVFQEECDRNAADLEKLTKSLSEEIKQLIDSIGEKSVAKDVKENESSSKKLAKDQKEADLKSLREKRNSEKTVYENESDEINRSLAVIRDGIKELQTQLFNAQSGTSLFLSRKSKERSEFQNSLLMLDKSFKALNAKESGIFSMINLVSDIMIKSATQSNNAEEVAVIEKYLDSLNTLKNKLEEDGGNLLNIELRRREIFETETQFYQERIKELDAAIKQLEEEILALKQEVNNMEAQKMNSEEKLKAKEKELKDTEKICFDTSQAYKKREQKRDDELYVIRELLRLFRENFSDTRDYIAAIDLNA